jgi:ubiquinol-cytochrome c reductase subunit 7
MHYKTLVGLRKEDLFADDYPVVQEALRRLPRAEQVSRQQRIFRALDLDFKNQILPRSQWVKPEEDIEYLSPVLRKVIRDKIDREVFRAG